MSFKMTKKQDEFDIVAFEVPALEKLKNDETCQDCGKYHILGWEECKNG